ncbi:MAG: ATP-binding protein, partial [Chloroflexi bacterium AL-W]|nr:ATP-binding protein [Chloroflexi bacterium AL-N5]NOK85078.1 ATP-binding protein [Chloroflexi bacterium AL-W]NOK91831.1 ATP-binding protein [Chloroflexi bacterium AL-N15]
MRSTREFQETYVHTETTVTTSSPQFASPIAVIGSPNSTTTFTVDILETARDRALDHAWVIFEVTERFNGRGYRKRALCQIGGIVTRNRWHEDPTIRAVIKHQGALPALSGESDLTSAQLSALGVFLVDDAGKVLRRTTLSTPPPSGTLVYPADATTLQDLVHTEPGIFYAGQSPGDGLPVPLTLRHFGSTEQGGFGEAVMLGIFGQTRSGKSIMASQLLAGFASNRELGMLVLDPQGEFGRDRFAAGDHRVDFSLNRMLDNLKNRRAITMVTTDDIALEGADAFTELLRRSGFFESLGFKGSSKEREAAERMAHLLQEMTTSEGKRRHIRNLHSNDIPLLVKDLARFADVIYATRPGTTPGEGQRAADVQARFQLDENRLRRIWNDALQCFRTDDGRMPLSQLIQKVLIDHAVVVLSFAQENADQTPYFLLNEILTRLRYVIHRSFQRGQTSNALVLLDEAHLFAGEHAGESTDGSRTRTLLAQSIRMTGKYGVGWMFITQTLHDFDKTILRQLQVKLFGQGFKIGADREYVETELGKEGFARYCSLPDPKRTGRYSFMVTGPIVSLGSLGTPLVIQGFRSTDDL